MLSWVKSNLLAVAIIVVLLIVALGSAADGWRTRKLLREQQALQQTALEEAARAKERELEEAEKAWLRVLNPVSRDRDALKQNLARAEAEKFVPPGSAAEAVARWRALGYHVEVESCR